MKFFSFILLINIIQIFTHEYPSPCEATTDSNPSKYEDCKGKSCEFIEEICCYMEAINETDNETVKECVDFQFYDYSRPELKKIAFEKIKNGTYWSDYDLGYSEIISMYCNNYYIFPNYFILLLLYLLI